MDLIVSLDGHDDALHVTLGEKTQQALHNVHDLPRFPE